ncbi:arsenate reductase (glutaredoxin) [Allohahella sp. A8]|uniref:arsenate reductase (glutaredoxin) n=1 Tax=Allohahella sp. A8 TaxID=3141461 RepID=UPI003A80BE82
MDITIYHNPACSKSRAALKLIKDAGVEPTVVEYLKNPPDKAILAALADRAGVSVLELMRPNEDEFKAMNLGDATTTEEARLDALAAHPRLINRPIVVAPAGVKVCRPPELVLDLIDASRS